MRALPLLLAGVLAAAAPGHAAAAECGTVGRGPATHVVSKRGPVSCAQARQIIRRRAVRDRSVAGWRCIRDDRGLVVGWSCRSRSAPKRIVAGNLRSEST